MIKTRYRDIRLQMHMNQTEFGRFLGGYRKNKKPYSPHEICLIEKGRGSLPIECVHALAINANCSMDYVCGLSDDIGKIPLREQIEPPGVRISKIRGLTGLTQAEFTKMLQNRKIAVATLSEIENGYRVPNTQKLACIASDCGVSIDWLSGYRDDRELY